MDEMEADNMQFEIIREDMLLVMLCGFGRL